MEIHKLAGGSVVRVLLRGAMDSMSGEQIRAALEQIHKENPDRDLEIHSDGLDYLSTVSFAHLLLLARRIHEDGRQLTLVDLPPQLQGLFQGTNEAGLIRIRSTGSGNE